MEKIRLGQLGIGHNHGEAKMLAARKRPDLFEIVGYAEEDEKWVEKRGNLEGYQGLTRMSVEEVIEKSDALLVECDVWNLTKYAKMCIDAGKHIHMDKPMSGSLLECKELLDCAEAKGLVVQLGYMYRYNPAIQEAIRRVRNGELGEITSINAEMSTYHGARYRQWLTNYQGGIMYILGSHLLDLIVYILGEPERVVPFMKHSGFEGIDFEDNDLAVLEYEKALAKIYVSSVEVNGFGKRQFFISGTKGTVNILPIERPTVMTWSEPSIATKTYADMKEIVDVPDLPGEARYDSMMADFYDYVKGNKENPFSYKHDYTVQKLLYEICCGDGALKPGITGTPGYDI